MPGLRETLEAATPGPWGNPQGFGSLALRAVGDDTYQRLAIFDNHDHTDTTWEYETVDGAANARLAALAPALAALVLDMGEALLEILSERDTVVVPSVPRRREMAALLARLDQIGKEPDASLR